MENSKADNQIQINTLIQEEIELIERWVEISDKQLIERSLRLEGRAEQYFSDLLKLVISLSTGLVAFWAASKSFRIESVESTYLGALFIGYFLSISFACFAIVSLSFNYKSFADRTADYRRQILVNISMKKFEELKKLMKEEYDEYFSSKGHGWQKTTIGLGLISLSLFILSMIFTILPFGRLVFISWFGCK